jgi:hypothetical protein
MMVPGLIQIIFGARESALRISRLLKAADGELSLGILYQQIPKTVEISFSFAQIIMETLVIPE